MSLTEKIIGEFDNLPTLPTIYSTLSEAVSDPNITIHKLASIISSDQSSSLKILKVVNSPFYGFSGKIDTISQAILYLGFNEIQNIIFALSVIKFFSKDKQLNKLRPVDLWAHSIGVGVITRIIGDSLGVQNLEHFFLSGILHDIGKIIFIDKTPKEYNHALDLVEFQNCSINEAEYEIFSIDHTILGEEIAKKWGLSVNIQQSIRYHDSGPVNNENKLLISTVHLSNIIARMLEFGYAGDNLIPQPNKKIWDVIKLPGNFFQLNKDKIENDFKHTIQLILSE